jgi:hypothetical protein
MLDFLRRIARRIRRTKIRTVDITHLVVAGRDCIKCGQGGIFPWDGVGLYCEECSTPYDFDGTEIAMEEWNARYSRRRSSEK